MDPLISIIIPTFNRAHLLGETLDSIIAQSYQNWECLVVDDGSNDYTKELLEFYLQKDRRIQYYSRPKDRIKGANSCRNYGFEKITGKYVNWFDSDDLMTPDNLKLKVEAFSEDIDFVIGNTVNFDEQGNFSRVFPLNYSVPTTAENYIGGSIGWITNDMMIRTECIEIRFNEHLLCGQEYNFFARLLYRTNKGKYLKRDVAKRRLHPSSIQGNLNNNNEIREENYFINERYLLQDIKELAGDEIINRSLRRLVRFSYSLTPKFRLTSKQLEVLRLLRSNKRFTIYTYYTCWIVCNLFIGKGYFFLKRGFSRLN